MKKVRDAIRVQNERNRRISGFISEAEVMPETVVGFSPDCRGHIVSDKNDIFCAHIGVFVSFGIFRKDGSEYISPGDPIFAIDPFPVQAIPRSALTGLMDTDSFLQTHKHGAKDSKLCKKRP